MKTSMITDRLRLEKKEFVTSEELQEYCRAFKVDHRAAIHYLTRMKYLVRIFRGIFYVKTLDEIKLGITSRYNRLQLVARGLELKGVENWYFGLHTALKLNNMTHEFFNIDEVVSDTVFRPRPVSITGNLFRFVKVTPELLGFGITRDRLYRYSDPAKTILDFIYLSVYRGVPEARIIMDVADWAERVPADTMMAYSGHYPKSMEHIASKVASEAAGQ